MRGRRPERGRLGRRPKEKRKRGRGAGEVFRGGGGAAGFLPPLGGGERGKIFQPPGFAGPSKWGLGGGGGGPAENKYQWFFPSGPNKEKTGGPPV